MQLILSPLWKAYDAATPGAETSAILGKIVKGLGLTQVCSVSSTFDLSLEGVFHLPDGQPPARARFHTK